MEEILHALSYLFYAVAHSDRHVDTSERLKIHQVVNENWQLLAVKGDPFGIKAMEMIDRMVTELTEDDYDTEKAYEQFKKVFEEHPEFFTPEMKEFVLEVCIRTANTFNQMNKSELVILSRIERLIYG
jgi:uncharacterized tellurite resistance protein B-like protein